MSVFNLESVNNTNVYNDQTSKKERGGWWSLQIPFVRLSFDDCDIFWGCVSIFFNRTFRQPSGARYKTKEFSNVTVITYESSMTYFWVVKRMSFLFSIFEETRIIVIFDRPPGDKKNNFNCRYKFLFDCRSDKRNLKDWLCINY